MTTCGRCIGEMLNAALSSIGTCNSRVPQGPRLARMRYLPVRNFIFQLHTEQEVEREDAPCAMPRTTSLVQGNQSGTRTGTSGHNHRVGSHAFHAIRLFRRDMYIVS